MFRSMQSTVHPITLFEQKYTSYSTLRKPTCPRCKVALKAPGLPRCAPCEAARQHRKYVTRKAKRACAVCGRPRTPSFCKTCEAARQHKNYEKRKARLTGQTVDATI